MLVGGGGEGVFLLKKRFLNMEEFKNFCISHCWLSKSFHRMSLPLFFDCARLKWLKI